MKNARVDTEPVRARMDPEELEIFYEKCSSVTENAAGWTVAAILEMDEK